MTRREELIAMRGRDLIELCAKLGVKINANRTSLKESKAVVADRILKFEAEQAEGENSGCEDTEKEVDASVDTALPVVAHKTEESGSFEALTVDMSDTPDRIKLVTRLETLSVEYPEFRAVLVPENEWSVGDLYDIFRENEYVASVLPCADKVFVTSPANSVRYNAVSIKYDAIDTWFAEIIKD